MEDNHQHQRKSQLLTQRKQINKTMNVNQILDDEPVQPNILQIHSTLRSKSRKKNYNGNHQRLNNNFLNNAFLENSKQQTLNKFSFEQTQDFIKNSQNKQKSRHSSTIRQNRKNINNNNLNNDIKYNYKLPEINSTLQQSNQNIFEQQIQSNDTSRNLSNLKQKTQQFKLQQQQNYYEFSFSDLHDKNELEYLKQNKTMQINNDLNNTINSYKRQQLQMKIIEEDTNSQTQLSSQNDQNSFNINNNHQNQYIMKQLKLRRIIKEPSTSKNQESNVLNNTFDELKKKIKLFGKNNNNDSKQNKDHIKLQRDNNFQQSKSVIKKIKLQKLKPIINKSKILNLQEDYFTQQENQINTKRSKSILNKKHQNIIKFNDKLKNILNGQEITDEMILFQSEPFDISLNRKRGRRKQLFNQQENSLDSLRRNDMNDFEPIQDQMFNTTDNFTNKRHKKKIKNKKLKKCKQSKSQPKILQLPFQTVDFKRLQIQKQHFRQSSQTQLLSKKKFKNLNENNLSQRQSPLNSSIQSSAQLHFSNKPSIILKKKIKQPPQFQLKEISKYSQRLSIHDLKGRQFSTVLQDGRHKNTYSNQRLKINENVEKFDEISNQNQIMEKILSFDWYQSKINQELINGCDNKIFYNSKESQKHLSETEVKYYKSQLKNQDQDLQKQLFQKSLHTLKYLFFRLMNQEYATGIANAFVKKHIQNNIKDETTKAFEQLLYQCELLYEINHLMRNVFRGILKFQIYEKSNDLDSLKTLGERLKNQINVIYVDIFMAFGNSRNNKVNLEKFTYNGEDFLKKIFRFSNNI